MVKNLEFKESTQHEPLTAHQKHHLFYKNYSIDGYVMDEYLGFDTGRPTPSPSKNIGYSLLENFPPRNATQCSNRASSIPFP